MKYREESTKTKLIPLCRTQWVERLNALEVTLDLAQAVSETFTDMVENSGSWNRETVNLDFEFLISLVIVQKVLACTSSLTTRLQSRGFDTMKAYAYEDCSYSVGALPQYSRRVSP